MSAVFDVQFSSPPFGGGVLDFGSDSIHEGADFPKIPLRRSNGCDSPSGCVRSCFCFHCWFSGISPYAPTPEC